MHMQPTENPHSLYFNQFTAPIYMHQLFWQTNVVPGNERGGGAMDFSFRCLMLLYFFYFLFFAIQFQQAVSDV